MALGTAVAIALLAAPASADSASGPAAPDPPKAEAAGPDPGCVTPLPSEDSREIIVCAERPEGYRINPDVMEAHRDHRSAGRPTRPGTIRDDSCASVGPMGCRGQAGINVLAAAATAAEMARRLSNGEEIGSMFQTDRQPSEYELYVAAKRRREAAEAEAAARAKAKAQAQEGSASSPE